LGESDRDTDTQKHTVAKVSRTQILSLRPVQTVADREGEVEEGGEGGGGGGDGGGRRRRRRLSLLVKIDGDPLNTQHAGGRGRGGGGGRGSAMAGGTTPGLAF